MELPARIDALRRPPPGTPAASHAALDEMLRGLAAEELDMLDGVLERWEAAGHPPGSLPDDAALEPDDTGALVDADAKTLIALPGEWAVVERVRAVLERRAADTRGTEPRTPGEQ